MCRWERHLAGFPHLGEVGRWLATPKRARIAHWSLSRDRRINMQLTNKMKDFIKTKQNKGNKIPGVMGLLNYSGLLLAIKTRWPSVRVYNTRNMQFMPPAKKAKLPAWPQNSVNEGRNLGDVQYLRVTYDIIFATNYDVIEQFRVQIWNQRDRIIQTQLLLWQQQKLFLKCPPVHLQLILLTTTLPD